MSRDPLFLWWRGVSRNGSLPFTSCSTVKVMAGRRLVVAEVAEESFDFHLCYHAEGVINIASPDSGWVYSRPEG